MIRIGSLQFDGSLRHLRPDLRPMHGPQTWPWWRLLSVHWCETNPHIPRAVKTKIGTAIWIYTRWGAIVVYVFRPNPLYGV